MEVSTEVSMVTPFRFYSYDVYLYTRLTIQGAVAVCGFLMNSVALYIILTKEKPISTQNRLLLNLFGVNCTLCGIILPVHLVDLSQGVDNDWGFFCVIQGSLINYAQCCAFLAYLHITLHRYFAVVFIKSKTKNIGYGSAMKTSLIVGLCNLIPGLLMLPGILGIWGKFAIEPSYGTCNLLSANNGGSASFNLFGQGIAIGIPLITMIYCYSHIIYTVKSQRKKVCPAPASSVMSGASSKQVSKPNRHDMRLTFASVMIIVLYMVSFFPYVIVEMSVALEHNVIAKALSGPLVLSHTLSDPAIYFAFDRKLRGHLARLLRLPFCKKCST